MSSRQEIWHNYQHQRVRKIIALGFARAKSEWLPCVLATSGCCSQSTPLLVYELWRLKWKAIKAR